MSHPLEQACGGIVCRQEQQLPGNATAHNSTHHVSFNVAHDPASHKQPSDWPCDQFRPVDRIVEAFIRIHFQYRSPGNLVRQIQFQSGVDQELAFKLAVINREYWNGGNVELKLREVVRIAELNEGTNVRREMGKYER